MKRQWRTVFACAVLCLVSACAAQLTYNYLPWWIDYYFSDYVSLTPAQQRQFDTDVTAFHQWHREHELPKLHALLSQLATEAQQPLTLKQIEYYQQQVNTRLITTMNAFTPTLANLLTTLSDEQVALWFSRMEKEIQEKEAKSREGSAFAQRERKHEKLIERADFWLDKITPFQNKQLLQLAIAQINLRPEFTQLREGYIAKLEQIVKTRKQDAVAPRLLQLWQDIANGITHTENKKLQAYLNFRVAALQRIDQNLTAAQRQYFQKELRDVNNDISVLMAR